MATSAERRGPAERVIRSGARVIDSAAKGDNLARTGKELGRDVQDAGERAAHNKWTTYLARFGYLVRGVLYAVVGLLALQIARGVGEQTANQQGALQALAMQPLGAGLLMLAVVGLAGYALWGYVRAVFDAMHKGSDAKGLAQRAGYLVSAIAHTGLLIAAVQLLTGRSGATEAEGSSGTAWLLSLPLGSLVVGIAGVWIIGAGLAELALAYTADFKKDLNNAEMDQQEVTLATWVGRLGLASRGVVFGATGVLLIKAAIGTGEQLDSGIDGALKSLAQSPLGPSLLIGIAIGLMIFGLYSALCARWIRIPSAPAAPA